MAILKVLKKDFQVNEALLRVGIPLSVQRERVSTALATSRKARPVSPWASSVPTTQRTSPTSQRRSSKSGKTRSTRPNPPRAQRRPSMANHQVRLSVELVSAALSPASSPQALHVPHPRRDTHVQWQTRGPQLQSRRCQDFGDRRQHARPVCGAHL